MRWPEGTRETRLTNWGKRLIRYGKRKLEELNPTWVRAPESLQIDTLNYCSCACEYCNVRQGGSFDIPRGRMETDMIKYIIQYWGRFKEMKIIAPFVNGEPMLDDRLPMICGYTRQHSNAYNLIDTNGTPYANRRFLIDNNLRVVRFTISANTPETYEIVHGRNLFRKAIKTFEWFRDHRLPNQNIVVHFIVTKNNEHEIDEWIQRFEGFLRKVFPLHRMPGIQLDSEQSLGSKREWIQSPEDSLEQWKKTRPLFIYPDGRRERHVIPKYQTCQGMSFAVMWDGTILHCTDAPPRYNYGHVYEVDMLEAWHERNRARINNPACIACNAKRPDWDEVLRRYVL